MQLHIQIFVLLSTIIKISFSSNILMMTLGGTKSHKIPFIELAKGLTIRGHNITFINGFTSDNIMPGVEEITPTNLVFYIKNFTNWDLIGRRMKGEEPVPYVDILRYPFQSCDVFLSDPEIKDFLRSNLKYDLLIMDGAFPECTVSFVHYFKIPFMYINTVGFYTGSLSMAGNPTPYSVTPFFGRPFTEKMSFIDRIVNTFFMSFANTAHKLTISFFVHRILKNHFGSDVPHPYDLAKNVSFILQNSHFSVTYPRPYLPNVAEVACIHCKAAKPLSKDLEEFISSGSDNGFIYVSMGSSVKENNMPEYLRQMFIRVFEQLPYKVLWKFDTKMNDLPFNVMTSKWLPQQDILGHKKIRAFVTHGGLLSMYETVFHGVPILTLPVFCDHDANSAKAELDGYAIKLELQTLTAENLLYSIKKIIHDPKYRKEVKRRQILFRDQKESALERAVYWTEYVLRHDGALHLQSPAKDMNIFQYYLIDVLALFTAVAILCFVAFYFVLKFTFGLVANGQNLNYKKLQ